MTTHHYRAIVPEEMFKRSRLRRRYGRPRHLYRWLIEQVIQSEIDRNEVEHLGHPRRKQIEIVISTECED